MTETLSPAAIMQIGMGFFASKTLLSAVELGLFTHLGDHELSCPEIERKVGLHPRSSADFLDGLVALGMLNRQGDGSQAKYLNTEQSHTYLVKSSPQYIGGILEMASVRLFKHWGHLTDALKTGKPQNEMNDGENHADLFAALYGNQERLAGFLEAMAGVQKGNFIKLADTFDFSKHGTVCDVGGASAAFSIAVARRHPKVKCISFDLPQVMPIASQAVTRAEVADRVTLASGDFFKDPLPKAGVITMGNILHDWGIGKKKILIRKAYEALPSGGCFIAIENIIDDERRKNVFGLMMSLNMLIETDDGFDYTGAQFRTWCLEAGFKSIEILPLTGPSSAAIAYKE